MFTLCRTCSAINSQEGECNLGNEQRALTGVWPIPAFTLALEKGYKVAKITEVWHFNKDCPNSKAPPNAQIWRMACVYPLWPTPSQDSFWAISYAHSLHLSLGLLIKCINLVCICKVNGTQHMHRNSKNKIKCLNQYLHSQKYFYPFFVSLESGPKCSFSFGMKKFFTGYSCLNDLHKTTGIEHIVVNYDAHFIVYLLYIVLSAQQTSDLTLLRTALWGFSYSWYTTLFLSTYQ